MYIHIIINNIWILLFFYDKSCKRFKCKSSCMYIHMRMHVRTHTHEDV